MADLKPCPFCGSSNLMTVKTINEYFDFVSYVKCKTCGVKTLECESPEVAAEAWNRRDGNG